MSNARELFKKALQTEQIDGRLADLAWSIYAQESAQGANAKTSNRGAVGGMQVIPATFGRMADQGWDIQNPEHNVRAGLRYLRRLDGLSGGDPRLTAAGYYGGEGAIPKARRGIAVSDPVNKGKAPTTLEYADQVVGRMSPTSALPARVDTKLIPPLAQIPQAPVGDGPVALPPEALAYLERRPPAIRPMPQAADPWQQFVAEANKAQAHEQPQKPSPAQGQGVPAPFVMPNFGAPVQNRKVDFKAWKPRLA